MQPLTITKKLSILDVCEDTGYTSVFPHLFLVRISFVNKNS